MIIALDQSDLAKLPFSDDVNKDSRLLMRRNIRDRVSALAPFLTYDPDAYIVLGDDGRLSWIMDAFTVSDSYPYSTHYRLDNNLINYMRNSVKVVIDAYDGTTTFYVFDTVARGCNAGAVCNAERRFVAPTLKSLWTHTIDLDTTARVLELMMEGTAQDSFYLLEGEAQTLGVPD